MNISIMILYLMKTIAFHCNQLCLRGSEVAVYDYAHYNECILGNKSIIVVCSGTPSTDPKVVKKFQDRFPVFFYNDKIGINDEIYKHAIHSKERKNKTSKELEQILQTNNCDVLYSLKYGFNDGVISNKIKTCVHCIFVMNQPHGYVYAGIIDWLSKMDSRNKHQFVPHIVTLPEINTNLRNELNIPENGIVFGRSGGADRFDIGYVHKVITEILKERDDIYFLMLNTNKFAEHSNIIYLDGNADLEYKTKFINSCDAMLHARSDGETFGLAIGEFSIRNKPIITSKSRSRQNSHLQILGKKALIYNNYDSLYKIINTFNKTEMRNKDWNAYRNYTPEIVMDKFNEVFL
jgi:hypothetical protein